jgi:hypothetical protein
MTLHRVAHDELIYTVPGALTGAECALWIQHGEGVGFDEAPVTTSQGAVTGAGAAQQPPGDI